uniref:Uncharacterized protein n=1 Tax=viral metagenome TaxID=1070528 RepID=A0A6C0ATE7_9ZZZZ
MSKNKKVPPTFFLGFYWIQYFMLNMYMAIFTNDG